MAPHVAAGAKRSDTNMGTPANWNSGPNATTVRAQRNSSVGNLCGCPALLSLVDALNCRGRQTNA